MTINAFKVMGMVGMLAEELSTIAVDGKVAVTEAFNLIKKICDTLAWVLMIPALTCRLVNKQPRYGLIGGTVSKTNNN